VTASDAAVRELMYRALPAPDPRTFEDWDAVSSRAGATPKHARRRVRRALVIAFAALALTLLALPATGLGSRLAELVWGDGTPVDTDSLSRQAREFLDAVAGEGPAVGELANDGKLAFYLIRKRDGSTCIAQGSVDGEVRLGFSHCRKEDIRPLLPSVERPIYKNVFGSPTPARGELKMVGIVGLVLPGISRVAVIDTAGNEVASASVTDHVFRLLDIPDDHAFRPSDSPDVDAIVAYDEEGREVYREPAIGGRG